MIFEQLFDAKSSTYTYIISSGEGREALIIDPVIEHTESYIQILNNLELKLVKVIDTHIHADHITGLNELNKRTNCTRVMGEKSQSEVIDLKLKDSEKNLTKYARTSPITDPINKDLKLSKPNIDEKASLNQEIKVMKATANITPGIAYPEMEKADR